MKHKLPERTNATDLTDNELLLLDALFQCSGISTKQLAAETYSFHMNGGYTHSLSDPQLDQTLSSLRLRQLAESELHDDNLDRWYLKEAGLRLWEQEREPLWDCYLMDWTLLEDDNWDEPRSDIELESGLAYPVSVIRSPTYEIIEKYVETAIACGLWVSPVSSVRVHLIKEDFSEDGPKIFPIMHCLYVPARQEDDSEEAEGIYQWTDWKLYHQQRVWWRTLNELESLQGKKRGV